MKQKELLAGKVALVTGGSSGIGFGTAKRLKEEGAFVYITGRRKEVLEQAASKLGSRVKAVQADSSKKEDMLRLANIIKEDKASIAVFPEGYTSLDGKLHPFRNGVFKIAQKAQVPIVVCTLQNTQQVFRNAARLKKTHVHLHLVGILYPEAQKGLTAVDIGNLVHHMMAQDLGPENVLQSGEES